jgi:DNA repair protein RadC
MTESTFWKDLTSGKFARMVKEESRGRQVKSPQEVYHIVRPLFAQQNDVERVYGIFLDTTNRILAIEELFTGSIMSAAIYPRELVKRIISLRASGIILIHNHPGKSTEPSHEDTMITRKIAIALCSIDVSFHDHIIVGDGFHSMADSGFMETVKDQFNTLLSG